MIVALIACLAFSQNLEPDSAFVGTWELTALSQAGRPRAGRGMLVVAPGKPGRPAEWIWELDHQHTGELITTRKPGKPWPIIGRHTPSPRFGSYSDRGGEGVYRLEGDRLIVAIRSVRARNEPDDDPFRPGLWRTIETYRRVQREPDFFYHARPFPKGPARLMATWDEAGHGVLQSPPRGVLNTYGAYDLGSGVRVIRRIGLEYLDDPPAPDLDPKSVPTGTIVRPAGKFDNGIYDVAYPTPSPEARVVIDAFRTQNPEAPARGLAYWMPPPKSMVFEDYYLGWDGILLSCVSAPDRIVAEVAFRPRVLGMSCYGTACLTSREPLLVEMWELREGKLHYLLGGPELQEAEVVSWLIPSKPARVITGPVGLSVRPRPAHLPPIDKTPLFPMLIHYRPEHIYLDDASRIFTEAKAPDQSSPEFTIHQAFYLCMMIAPPAARKDFFAEVLNTPGYRQGCWQAVINAAVREGDDIRAEIFVWPAGTQEGAPFREISIRPFLETWRYKDHRLSFVSGRPASEKSAGGRR